MPKGVGSKKRRMLTKVNAPRKNRRKKRKGQWGKLNGTKSGQEEKDRKETGVRKGRPRGLSKKPEQLREAHGKQRAKVDKIQKKN